MPAVNTLNKNQRLKSRKTIDAVFKESRSFSVFPFRVLYLVRPLSDQPETPDSDCSNSPHHETDSTGVSKNLISEPGASASTQGASLKTGFSAPTKNFKKAVDRNRIKRLTKEAFRLNLHELQDTVNRLQIHLSLFLIFTGKELPNQALVTEKILVVLQALIKKLNESHPSNS